MKPANHHPGFVVELWKLLEAHVPRIASNNRWAAFVKEARTILSEPGNLSKLRDDMGTPNTKVGYPPGRQEKLRDEPSGALPRKSY